MNWGIKVLQTSALPLGYAAIIRVSGLWVVPTLQENRHLIVKCSLGSYLSTLTLPDLSTAEARVTQLSDSD